MKVEILTLAVREDACKSACALDPVSAPIRRVSCLSYETAAESTGYVDLQPGHTYQVLKDTFADFNKAFVWMEDADPGAVQVLLSGSCRVKHCIKLGHNPEIVRFSILG